MSLVLNVEILGEFKQLTAATKGAQNSLNSLNKRTKAISNGMNRAFAAIGVGFSLRIISQQLEEAGKAAVEDTKSMNLLALAMENSANATKSQVAQAEKAINRMQFQAGVADDQLRPAYQKLFIATGSVTESNRLLAIALDASAATGKGLDVVSQAMAKSLAGSDTALIKLIPSLKGAKDPMAELEATFKGAAEAAANTDPYQRMQVLFGEMQEQIGMALLPTLNKLSAWLATPEGQAKLQSLVDFAVLIVTKFGEMASWVAENKDWLVPMVVAIGAVTTAFKVATAAAEAFKTASLIAGVITGTAAGAAGAAGVGAAIGGFQQGQTLGQQSQIYGQGFKQLGSKVLGKNSGTTVNINVKTIEDAKTTLNSVKRFQNATGTSLGRAITG
jgi:hypothetical protein